MTHESLDCELFHSCYCYLFDYRYTIAQSITSARLSFVALHLLNCNYIIPSLKSSGLMSLCKERLNSNNIKNQQKRTSFY